MKEQIYKNVEKIEIETSVGAVRGFDVHTNINIDLVLHQLNRFKTKGATHVVFTSVDEVISIDITGYNVRLETDDEYNARVQRNNNSRYKQELKDKAECVEYERLKEKYEHTFWEDCYLNEINNE